MNKLWLVISIFMLAFFSQSSEAVCFPGEPCAGGSTTLSAPGSPSSATLPSTSTSGSYTLNWGASSGFSPPFSMYYLDESKNAGSYTLVSTPNHSATSYNFSSKGSGTYKYRIKACNFNGDTEKCSSYRYSNTLTVSTKPSTPAAPSSPATSLGSAYVSWTKPSGNVTYYDLQKRNNSGSWVTAKNGDTNTNETLSGLTDGSWDYRVRACNGYDWACSSYSSDSSNTIVRLAPSTPSNPTVPTNSPGVHTINWNKPAGAVTSYDLIEYKNGSSSYVTVASDSTATSKTVTGKDNGSYTYRVRACNQYNWACSSYSSNSSAVNVVIPIPGTPGSISVPATSTTGNISVSWGGSTGTVGLYNLQQSKNSGGWTLVTPSSTALSKTLSLAHGVYVFRVQACNESGCSSYRTSSSLTVNRSPSAVNESVTVTEDETKNIPVLSNDSDPDADTISINRFTTNPAHGSVSINGIYAQYKPTQNYCGSDSFSYEIKDSYGYISNVATTTITVTCVNDVPVISQGNSLTKSTNEDEAVNFTLSATDIDSSTLTWSLKTSPSHGSVSGLGTGFSQNLTYIPGANNNSNVSFEIKVDDGNDTDVIMINITVNPINDEPVISQGEKLNISTNEDTAVSFTLSAIDVDNSTLTWSLESSPAHGSVVGFGTGNSKSLTFTPNTDNNANVSFRVKVSDGSKTDSIIVEVTINPINDSPQGTVSITGNAKEGETLSIANSITDKDGTGAFSYQWKRNSNNISGATNATYVATNADIGELIKVTVSYIDGYGTTENVTSPSFGPIRADIPVWYEIIPDKIIPDHTLISPNLLAQQAVGAIEGQASVSGGAASYSIPIALPPGRAGMQPSVSLNYSSRGGNGIAGVGWSLSAGSSIHRCGQIAAVDPFSYGVTYSAADDRLCLDGQRLIVTSGTYGASGATYRTEIDSFAQVTQTNHINASASYFKVEHKNGRIAYYGSAVDARHAAGGRTENLSWAIKQENDQSLNNIIYHYSEHITGEHLLDSIDYTGDADNNGNRHVEFIYSEERPDKSVSYLAGGKTQQFQRLDKIVTLVGSDKVREYQLSYAKSELTKRSILDNVEECAFDKNTVKKCLPITRFNTHTPSIAWSPVDSSDVNQSEIANMGRLENGDQVRLKDLNGDGIAEALYLDLVESSPGSGVYDNDVRIHQLVDGKYDWIKNITDNKKATGIYAGIEGDINGDGITDFIANDNSELVYYQFDQNFNLQTFRTNFFLTTNYDKFNSGQGAQLIDINGDGYQDIVFTNLGINGNVQVAYYRNKANGKVDFYPVQTLYNLKRWSPGSISEGYHQTAALMDLNGDGLLDVVLSYQSALNKLEVSVAFTERTSTGALTKTEKNATQLNLPTNNNLNQYLWADLNGDGLKDFVRAVKENNQFDWKVRLNRGNGTFDNERSLNNNLGIHEWPLGFNDSPIKRVQAKFGAVQVADLDSDGAEELLVATTSDDDQCVVITGPKSTGGEVFFEACNDAIHNPEHRNFEHSSEELKLDFTPYDLRRFHWSILDFEIQNDGQLGHQRTIANVAYAPIQSTSLIDGTYSPSTNEHDIDLGMVSSLGLTDYNNDGSVDFSFRTLDHYRYKGDMELGGGLLLLNGIRVASFKSGNPAKGFFVQLNQTSDTSRQQDTVYQVENGLGQISRWDYAPISRPELVNGSQLYSVPADREAFYISKDPKREHFYFTSSMPVVTNFYQSNGLIDNGVASENETTYRYSEAVYNRMGRGFQGFRSISVDSPAKLDADGNVSEHIRSVTDFRQIFPYAGKIESARSCIKSTDETCSTTALSQTNIDYAFKNTANEKTYWVVPTNNVAEKYDLTDYINPLSRQTTSIDINNADIFGNIDESLTTVFNGYSTVENKTKNHFLNDTQREFGLVNYSNVLIKTINNSAAGYNALLDPIKEIKTAYTWTTERKPDVVSVAIIQGAGKSVSTDTDYNSYGLPIKVTITSPGELPRIVNTDYSEDYYFVDSVTNALGSVTSITSALHGQVISMTDLNQLTRLTAYDAFGRIEQVSPPTGTGQPAYSRFALCEGGCDSVINDNIKYKVTTQTAGAPTSIVYKDQLNRVVLSTTEGFDGSLIYQSVDYDALGRITFESVASFSPNEDKGTHYNNYDILGRLTAKKVDQAQNQWMEVDYTYAANGDQYQTKIEVSPSLGQSLTMYRTHSGTGQLIQTTDAIDGETQYVYDAMGNPIVLMDANSNAITAQYNALGQKIYVDDPNMGRKDFTYTGYGEVDLETDAKGNSYNYNYDTLGRLTHRFLGANLDAEFKFDEGVKDGGGVCKGMPHKEIKQTGSSYQRIYSYDKLCRPKNTVTKIDGTDYQMSTQYDAKFGRPKAMTYPSGLTVESLYNNLGYVTHSKNAANDYVYHKAEKMDARGQLTQAQKANGVINEYADFDPVSGQMTHISAVSTIASSGNQRHVIDYQYLDGYGNLTRQDVDNMRGSTNISSYETYQYDKLHRLTTSRRNINGTAQADINYAYDAVGNFTLKDDYVASYTYGNAAKSNGGKAGPNAVRSINKVATLGGGSFNYSYDANGNLESGDGKTITYNAFNKPVSILKNSITSTFSYGADQMRYKQVKTGVAGGTETTHYIDKAYEVIMQNGVTKKRAYLGDAILTETVGGSAAGFDIGFVHRDRLGSVVSITDENGNVVDNKSYDPFGKPRKGTFEKVDPAYKATLENVAWLDGFTTASDDRQLTTRRGFTDHEHLDDAELIHMNGRVYDYNLGRFLSVDPFIQEPGNSQSMNPYSYIMNNPLAGTDPSGYLACTTDIGDCLKNNDPYSFSANGGQNNGTPAVNNGNQDNQYIQVHEGNSDPSKIMSQEKIVNQSSDPIAGEHGGNWWNEGTANGHMIITGGLHEGSSIMNGVHAAGGALQAWGDTITANGNYIANNPGTAAFQTLGLAADTLMYFPDMALDNLTGLGTGAWQRTDARIGGTIDGIGNSFNSLKNNAQNRNYSGAGADALLILTALIPRFIGRGKNPPINTNRQILHTNGTDGKSQFRQGTNVENIVQDTWQNGTPRFNSNGDIIGKLKTYKDTIGADGQKTVDVRFSKKHGIHGFPSNKVEGQ